MRPTDDRHALSFGASSPVTATPAAVQFVEEKRGKSAHGPRTVRPWITTTVCSRPPRTGSG